MYSTMTILKALLLAFLTALSGCAHAATTASKLAAYTVKITAYGQLQCTGGAVGKHTVVTAKHCLDFPTGVLKFNGEGCKGDSMVAYDGTDTVLITTCATFPHYTKFSPETPQPGERVGFWGYPLGMGPFYRKAVFAGDFNDLFFYKGKPMWMWDASSAPGDSGAPLFDEMGRIYCTLSHSLEKPSTASHFHLMACYPPRFTSEQLGKII